MNRRWGLYELIGDRVGQTNINWGLGRRLANNEHYKEAVPLFEQAVALVEEIDHPVAPAWREYLEEVRKKSDSVV